MKGKRSIRWSWLGLVLVLAVGLSSAALAGPLDYVGTWTNTNPATGGMIKMVITSDGVSSTVRGYGACTPTPCDWGSTTLYFGGFSVVDAAGAWGIATWDFGFSKTTIVIWPKGSTLMVEKYTVFLDGSGRTPYCDISLMER